MGDSELTLLASTETNDLAVKCVADTVRLGVLERDSCYRQITLSRLRESTGALRDNDGVEGFRRHDLGIVAVLLESDAVDGPCLLGGRNVVVVHLKDEVLATLLLLEDVESLLGVTGRNYTIGDLSADNLRGWQIDLVGKSNHVTKAGHSIGTTSPGVSLGKTRVLDALNVVDHVDLPLLGAEGNTDSGTSWGDVLEAGSSGIVQGLAQLLDQRPCVQGIQQVDVSWRSTEDLEGQRLVGHGHRRRLLVGIGAVSQRKELLAVSSVLLPEEFRDSTVVCGCLLESLERISLPVLLRDLAIVVLKLGKEVVVVAGVADDGDARVVLGRSSQQSDTADVNLLYSLGDRDVDPGHGLREGVQVADDEVDLVDAVR